MSAPEETNGNNTDQINAMNETIRKQAEEIVTLHQQAIQSERLSFLGQLSAGIMHEIKNPLNFVNNFSRLSLELITELKEVIENANPPMDKTTKEDLTDIIASLETNTTKVLENGQRAERIALGMLAQAREKKSVDPIPTDINQMVEEYAKLAYQGVRGEDKEFNVALKFTLDASIGTVKIVPQDLSRVVINIVNNACYALNEKKKALGEAFNPEIHISTRKADTHFEIYIKDNGTGMPQSVIDNIFNPFYTTKPMGKGTGLGLSLCNEIVVQTHKGEIKVVSEDGQSTEFKIRIPLNL